MKYYLKLNKDNKILERAIDVKLVDDYVEVSHNEFITSKDYIRFEPTTRDFSEELIAQDVIHNTEVVDENVERENIVNLSDIESMQKIDDKLNKIMEHLGIQA